MDKHESPVPRRLAGLRITRPRWGLLLGLLAVVAGCAGGAADGRPAAGSLEAPLAQSLPAERRLLVEVREANLVLADEAAAKGYLRQKLVALMAQQLLELGFEPARAVALASEGRLEAFSAVGREARVQGEGAEQGQVKQVVLWQVDGRLEVALTDARLAELADRLERLPLVTMEEVEAVERHLGRFAAHKPEPARLEALQRKAGGRWAELLRPYLKTQLDTALEPMAGYLEALARVAVVLRAFRQAHPVDPVFDDLSKEFILGCLRLQRSLPVGEQGFAAVQALLTQVRELAGDFMPQLMPYLQRDLELAWRDHLVTQDEQKKPFPGLKQDFLRFLELFPRSQFYPDLELRFLARWVDHLQAIRPQGLEDLEALEREVGLLAARFPTFARLPEVQRGLGQRCLESLERLEAKDLEQMRRIQAALGGCDPFLPAGQRSVDLRARLDDQERALLQVRDDELERAALKELTFFIEWDKAIRGLSWGAKRAGWLGRGEFARRWATGQDAGEACRCSLDPEEPCRVFPAEGPAGGFEVVARFHRERLVGVDVCDVYAGASLGNIYRFYARRFDPQHDDTQGAAFLSGVSSGPTTQGVRFLKPGEVAVDLERAADTATVRYRSAKALEEMEKDRLAEREQQAQALRKAREDRLRRGWEVGACVRWGCDPECDYTGRIKLRQQERYLITITKSEGDPREEGSDRSVAPAQIFDCL
ncbi:MAG TPA: hypothetical protein PK668_05500 [Myxococcota bacterium]|nr:hypothetical protein [Myxococcota bacterium]HRY92705.1 hypothetical protein [Myxococcota bacterium]HSA24104.1 hypothetical protein [Myxococcota bacterium]